MVVLSTIEQALAYLSEIQDRDEVEEVSFAGELASFRLTVDGDRYHSTVPGELARGLWQLQESLYSAAAFALTGESDIRRLSLEQRSNFELVFKVEEGSSEFWASLGNFLNGLGEGFAAMDSKHKAITLILSAVIIAGGVTAWKALDASAETKKAEVQATLNFQMEEQKTRQFEILARATEANPVAKKFDQAMSDGTKAVARGAADADEIKIGRTILDSDEIKESNRRAQRTPTTSSVIDEHFRVFTVNVREAGVAKYVLAGPETGEFVASLDEQSFTPDERQRVIDAAHNRRDIRLEVLTTVKKGTIQSAKILQVM